MAPARPLLRVRRVARLAVIATAASLLLASCSADVGGGVSGSATGSAVIASASVSPAAASEPLTAATVLSDPKTYEGPSTATLGDAAIAAVEAYPAPTLPVTVTSRDPTGDTTETVRSAARIIAVDLSGSIAGTIAGLGLADQLAGRDTATTLPGLADLPLVTSADGQSIDAETILSLRPSVVVTDGTVGPTDVVQQLRESGVAVVYVENESSFAGAEQLALHVAEALGVPRAGERLAARIAREVAAEKREIAAVAPEGSRRLKIAFLYLRGASGIYYLFGEGSGADTLVQALGGIDVAASIGWSGMKPMTDEAMVKMDPDLILVMTGGLGSVGGVDGLLAAKPAIALTAAGQHRRFVDMADGDVLSFGPRSAQVLDALAHAVYAPEAAE